MKCGDKSKLEYKYLENKWPKMVEAPDPTLINWQNLGYGSCSRCWRSLIVNFACIVIVLGSFYLIVFAVKTKEAGAKLVFKPAECGQTKFD
jgi:hypothetical protein